MASFDKEISNADIAYIDGNLRNFEKKAAKLYAELEYQGYKQQLEVTIIKAIDATFMWMKAIGSGISAMINMMKGDFSGFAATEAAITAAAKETLNAVKSQAVYDQIKIASETFRLIIVGFKDNQKQLEKTKAIVDKLTAGDTSSDEFKQIQKDFIQAYKDYTPKVSGTQIQKLTAAWGEVVSKLESLMDSMQTKEAITASTKSFMNSQFFKTKIIVPQLSETLSGRFAFQFDLMDALTGVVRAHTSIQAAEGLSKGYSDLEPQLAKSKEAQVALDQMALSTYILSQFHLLLILSQFCNAVTYVNAGVEPFQCKNALRTMDVIHIDDALSYEPPSCDPVKVDLKIPTSGSGKADNVNFYRLNSGESVAFQIPNFNWLKVHGEMSENDRASALFVKRFEIYAITNDSFKISKNLRVEVTPSGSAPIIPGVGQTKYELVPRSRVKYVFEYKENENCQEPNPYYVCSPGQKKNCFQSPGELKNSLDAYPSIYSPWTIKLDKKIGNAPDPAPETKVYLQAKLGLCRKSEDSNVSSRRGRKRVLQKMKKRLRKNHVRDDTNGVPCPQGKYFNQDSGLFAACKPGSTPQRHGYYCEVNKSGSQSG